MQQQFSAMQINLPSRTLLMNFKCVEDGSCKILAISSVCVLFFVNNDPHLINNDIHFHNNDTHFYNNYTHLINNDTRMAVFCVKLV